ncbi:hypothetical protein ACFV2U_44015 [Streptomyces sp. NPDC059697]|uniref:hypothetical protein n=1 Tax=Streptomyces sp. NPDC059697 TaxID=3346912 RepID=UPI003691D1DE
MGFGVSAEGGHETAAVADAGGRHDVAGFDLQREALHRLERAGYQAGDPAAIAAKVREHLAAGADHVTLLPQVGTGFSVGVDQLKWLAPALVGQDSSG